MTLVSSLDLLLQRLQKLHDELTSLRTMATEDKPDDSLSQPETIGEIADDLIGWMQESLAACRQARQAIEFPLNLALAQQHLRTCQSTFDRVLRRFFTDLARYERVVDLVRVGRARGKAWQRWSSAVRRVLDACYLPLFDTYNALTLCWQEFVEQGTNASFIAHSITIHLSKGL